ARLGSEEGQAAAGKVSPEDRLTDIGLFDHTCRQICFGKAVTARMSAWAASRCSATAGSLPPMESSSLSNWACTASASGWWWTEGGIVLTAGQADFGQTDMRFAA